MFLIGSQFCDAISTAEAMYKVVDGESLMMRVQPVEGLFYGRPTMLAFALSYQEERREPSRRVHI
jgi:hypothetical protein